MNTFYVYNYVYVRLLKCGCGFFSWDKNGIQCSHKNKKIILQRIRERGHARGKKLIFLIPLMKHRSANTCTNIGHAISRVWTLDLLHIL